MESEKRFYYKKEKRRQRAEEELGGTFRFPGATDKVSKGRYWQSGRD